MPVWIRILRLVGPPLLSALFPASRITPIVLAAVEAAEQHGEIPGAEKKAIALRNVADGVASVNSIASEPIAPAAAVHEASDAIDALVATVNAWTKAAPVASTPASPLDEIPDLRPPAPGARR
jgi:hypothetical protein